MAEDASKETKVPADTPMQPELKFLDRKYTSTQTLYYEETAQTKDIPDQVDWWQKFVLCQVRTFDQSNRVVTSTYLQVNSPHVKKILKEIIGDSFPGISFKLQDISVPSPYRVLYHYRDELIAARSDLASDSDEARHMDVLLSFINNEFKDTITESKNLRAEGLMSYEHLWTMFRPGMTIYSTVFGQPRAFTLSSYDYVWGQSSYFQFNSTYVDFDGDKFGTRDKVLAIRLYSGTEKITDLGTYPIDLHPTKNEIEQQLIERGRQFEDLAGINFRAYQSVALEAGRCGFSRYSVNGRVVVDTKTFHRLNADQAFNVTPLTNKTEETVLSSPSAGRGRRSRRRHHNAYDDYDEDQDNETAELVPDARPDLDPLTDAQCLLATATVRGFSFAEKRWLDFFVDKLEPIKWDKNCFDYLVLPSAQKELVRALVATHIQERLEFDDIVKGKGKGLVPLLHGPPGVGKTLTAETVAEYCKRPLYVVSSGDLGINSETLDERLSRILDMASTWKAVLLIDEADVFLERRSLHDLERNSLVSIFLRVLEYYQGILFLTSNRVSTFDDAFKSRIHVPLKYNDLTSASRKKIWRHFLDRVEGGAAVDEKGCEELAKADLNGRQIKNVIKTATSLSQFHGQKLDAGKLTQVVGIQMEFEAELATGMRENGVAAVKADVSAGAGANIGADAVGDWANGVNGH